MLTRGSTLDVWQTFDCPRVVVWQTMVRCIELSQRPASLFDRVVQPAGSGGRADDIRRVDAHEKTRPCINTSSSDKNVDVCESCERRNFLTPPE